MLKIAINRHIIRSNLKGETDLPPITVYRSGRPVLRGRLIEIPGPSMMFYCPDTPLKCGARVWLETDLVEVLA